jgi:hypothetical protein
MVFFQLFGAENFCFFEKERKKLMDGTQRADPSAGHATQDECHDYGNS